ncbi:MAG: GDP-L-fucose synthase family protein [Chloroflexota bacterium]
MIDLRGKRILVTGSEGFLGGTLVGELARRGCQTVLVSSRRDYDLLHAADVRRLMRDTKPQIVFHLAARIGGIGANVRNPGTFLYENAIMGVQLMEEARLSGVEKFITAGTVCSYPKDTPVPFREDSLWEGYPEATNAPYGIAKKLLLAQGQAYRAEFGFDAIHLLCVNLFGPGDKFDPQTSHVIPAMIRRFDEAIRDGRQCVVHWGDGTPTREFLYVSDAAEAFVLAAERLSQPAPVNIGSGIEVSMGALAQNIGALMGYRGEHRWDASKPNGQPRRCLDTTRAKELFGFEAHTDFGEGLRKTVDWYRANRPLR